MHSYISPTRFTLGLALLVPGIALIWLLAVPDTFTTFSAVLVAALSAAFAAVAVVTYRNAQADGTVAQLLHEVDVTGPPRAAAVRATTPQTHRKV